MKACIVLISEALNQSHSFKNKYSEITQSILLKKQIYFPKMIKKMMLVLSLLPSKKNLFWHILLFLPPLDPFHFLDIDDAFFYLLMLSIYP